MKDLGHVIIYYLQDREYIFFEYVDEVINVNNDHLQDFCEYVAEIKLDDFNLELLKRL
jgi:hypothetical protein